MSRVTLLCETTSLNRRVELGPLVLLVCVDWESGIACAAELCISFPLGYNNYPEREKVECRRNKKREKSKEGRTCQMPLTMAYFVLGVRAH